MPMLRRKRSLDDERAGNHSSVAPTPETRLAARQTRRCTGGRRFLCARPLRAPAMPRNRAAIARTTKPFELSLSAINSQYFIGGIIPDSAIPAQQSATILKFDRIEAAGSVLRGSGIEPFWTGYRKTGRSRLCKGTRKTWTRRDSRAQERRLSGERSFRLTQPTVGLEWFYYNVSRESRLLFEYFLDEFEIRLAVLWRRQGSL